jgi:osmotically-inducible protein OsmY
MTRLMSTMLGIAGLTLSGTAFMACAATPPASTHESTGEYIDDSVITAKVKAAVLDEASLKSFQIGVETFKGVVQLSGFVDSRHAVQRAGEVAKAVKGVASVKNDLVVK